MSKSVVLFSSGSFKKRHRNTNTLTYFKAKNVYYNILSMKNATTALDIFLIKSKNTII